MTYIRQFHSAQWVLLIIFLCSMKILIILKIKRNNA